MAILDQLFDLLVRQSQHVACRLLELALFIGVDVRPGAFRETISENRALSPAQEDDRSVSTRLALSWARDPLLDDAAAEVGIDLSFFSARYRVHQNQVADFFLSSKPFKPAGLEDSRAARSAFHTSSLYRTGYYPSSGCAGHRRARDASAATVSR